MENNTDIVKQEGRILYVEPNDLYGYVDGVPVTPDYSDYCISVNLIAEVVTRFKQSGDDPTKKYIFSWSTRPKTDSDGNPIKDEDTNWISFLQGQEAKLYGGGDGTFLTTYYTDINYDDIVKDNIVEGLGIESVQVSFESYYTPTIVIKFIDVRGSSLFGREEATHVGGKDLTASSIFGVFFTIPYPKFKLQIKGFYGHAVTYQLTCSDFKASFNSQTGNFEAVATFIGYSYSLLTDIPLRYIVAAPKCDYAGKSYWESKVNSPEWALSDGSSPQLLADIINNIRGLLGTGEEEVTKKTMTDEESDRKNNLENEIDMLTNLGDSLSRYVKAVEDTFPGYFYVKSDESEQLIIFSDTQENLANGNIKTTSKTLTESFEAYNTAFADKSFPNNLMPNNGQIVKTDTDNKFSFADFCIIEENNSSKKISFKNITEQSKQALQGIKLNNISISETLADRLLDEASKKSSNFKQYAYLFDLNNFLGQINERIENLKKSDTELDEQIKLRVQNAARDLLKFTPYIGDVFKIIMCHLETFIHMMWECFNNIKNSDRSLGHLNISLEQTDFVNVDNTFEVGAWPGVFNNGGTKKEDATIDSSLDGTIAWIGDFSHNFEEEKLINELYKAIEEINNIVYNDDKPSTIMSQVPVMPSDINNISSLFDNRIDKGISSLAGYLSFRAAQIFGVLLNDDNITEFASQLGKMDAYNYFIFNGSRSDIKNNLLNAGANSTLDNDLYNISICSNDGDKFGITYAETNKTRHPFETQYCIDKEYNSQNRHPMFKEDGDNLKYVHYYTKDKVGLVPDKMLTYESYNAIFPYKGAPDNPYFEFTVTESDDYFIANGFLHKSPSKLLFSGEDAKKCSEYSNSDMFGIEKSDDVVDSVTRKYEELKSGTFQIYGDEYHDDFSSVLEKLWHVSSSDYGSYFKGNTHMLSRNLSELGVNDEELYGDDLSSSVNRTVNFFKNEKWLQDDEVRFNTESGQWSAGGSEQTLNNLVIKNLLTYYPINGGNYEIQSLFGDPFYYLQNTYTPDAGTEEDYRTVNKRSKALLFLHTLNYDYSKIAGFLKKDKKSGGLYAMPYGYLLLLGGLLWRYRYFINKGNDPIRYGKDYKEAGADKTFFVDINGQYRMCALRKKDTGAYINVSTLFGASNSGEYWQPDFYVINKLIPLFFNFVDNEWPKLMRKFELRHFYDGKVYDYVYEDFTMDVINFKKDLSVITFLTVGTNPKVKAGFLAKLSNEYFYNFYGNYKHIYVKRIYRETDTRGLLLLFNTAQADTQDILKMLYTKKVIVIDSSGIRYSYDNNYSDVMPSGNKEIVISKSAFKSYLQGFRQKLEEIVNNEYTDAPEEYGSADVTLKRDIQLAMYLYLKTLWDRWLVSTSTKKYKNRNDGSEVTVPYHDYYNVEHFFNSFIFIDAFYRNIYDKFLINCTTLMNSYYGRDENGSLFQFIGDITSKHNCLFLALPDYVDMGNIDNGKAKESMKNMFRPIPFNEMNGLDDENRFVVIYTPRMSEVPAATNNYREDFIRIWNPAYNRFEEELPGAFKLEPVNNTNNTVTRYGYYVPSFGVAFSRQNNHLFKNISLDMTTPLVTSASVYALSNIALKGSGDSHKVAFMGQDLYPVFSNYSYICEIEMMGDAQIQPLMYFQLMNIPMWSGVYMIFNVTHTITAGNMTTKFKGMKLSRNPLPYNSSWYSFKPDNTYSGYSDTEDGGYSGYGAGGGSSDGVGQYDDGNVDYTSLGEYERVFRQGEVPPVATSKTACKGVNIAQMRDYFILRCMSFFVKNGLTVAQAGGVVGNFMAEGLPCFAQKFAKDSNGVNSFGLSMMNELGVFPWYKTYCNNNGLDWMAVQPQLQFMLEIIRGNEPKDHRDKKYNKLTSDFKNDNMTYTDAAISFAHNYERCAACGYQNGSSEYSKRANNAKIAVDLYNKNIQNNNKGTNGSGVPLIVGDSWAVGMSPYFEKQTGGISAAVTSSEVGPMIENVENIIKSAAGQIKDSMAKKPRYILLYSGLNSTVGGKRSDKELERMFNECCDNANGTKIYISSICYVGSNVSDKDVNRVNTIISKVCANKPNAIHIKLDTSEMENFRKTYCPKSPHPNNTGYEKLYQMIHAKMGV